MGVTSWPLGLGVLSLLPRRGVGGGRTTGSPEPGGCEGVAAWSRVPCGSGRSGGRARPGNFTASDSAPCLAPCGGGHSQPPSQRWEDTMRKGSGTTPESPVCCLTCYVTLSGPHTFPRAMQNNDRECDFHHHHHLHGNKSFPLHTPSWAHY